MKSKIFEELPKAVKTSAERWVRVLPDQGEGYQLYDVFHERIIGRILVDANDYWIYDGNILTIEEQEEIAGLITGNQREMNDLIKTLFY